jgi:hypothetical protein
VRDHNSRADRGQTVPLLAAFVVFAGLAMIALAHLGGGAVDRAAAKRAADVAALAGAAEGSGAAGHFAELNHASLRKYEESDDDATVEVRHGDARAVSRAHRDGGGDERPGGPAPALRAALARAAQILGHAPTVVRASGYVAEFSPASYAELAPRAAEAGLCASGPNQMKVCGSAE